MSGLANCHVFMRKALVAVMALMMGLAGLLLCPQQAQAATDFDVWVGGVRVNNVNMNDVLGDGTVSFVPGQSSETPGTLTLTNAHITPADVSRGGNSFHKVGIYLGPNANCSITLSGNNTIASANSPAQFGILSEDFLGIHRKEVDASLDIYAGVNDSMVTSRGIESTANIVIDAGLFLNIHCSGGYCNGIEAWSSYGINNSGYLTINMGGNNNNAGVYIPAPGGCFVVSGIGKATIEAAKVGVWADKVNVGGYQTSYSAELLVRSFYVMQPYTSSLSYADLDFSNLSDGYAAASYNYNGSDYAAYDPNEQTAYFYLRVLSNTPYDIWFGNIQVNALNQDDILGDGTAWFEPGAGPNPDTLYLDGCDFYTEGLGDSSGPGAYIFSTGASGALCAGLYIERPTLRISVSGSNWIQNNKDQVGGCYGIVSTGELEIVGNDVNEDSLYAISYDGDPANPTLGDTCGICTYGNITASSCYLYGEGGGAGENSVGLFTYGGLSVLDGAEVSAVAYGTESSTADYGAAGAVVEGYVYVDSTSVLNCSASDAPNNWSCGLVYTGAGTVVIEGDGSFNGSMDAANGVGIWLPAETTNEQFVLAPASYLEAYGVDQALRISPNFPESYVPYVRYGFSWMDTVGVLSPGYWVYTGYPYLEIIPKPTEFYRLAGDDRYQTAASIVNVGFHEQHGTVILVSGENFPDALCASSLAGCENAPIIMTKSSSLSPAAKILMLWLAPSHIIVVGGTGAVSDSAVSAACSAANIPYDSAHVTRYFGKNRYETSLDLYQGFVDGGYTSDTCIIATGGNFADALSISPYAYASGTPIFLADPKTLKLDAATEAAIKGKFDNVIIVGGTGVVSDKVVEQVGATSKVRLAGTDRYKTSLDIAQWEMGEKSLLDPGIEFQPSYPLEMINVSVAFGGNFPDALAGGALCGKNGSVLLLVSESNYANQVKLVKDNVDEVGQGYIFGGTGAVSNALKTRFDNALQ